MESQALKIKIKYDPQLMEELVSQELKRREQAGDFDLFEAYHRLANLIYEKSGVEERGSEFEKLDKQFFLKLGFGEPFDKVFNEFSELMSKVEAALVRKAITNRDEGADLSNNLKSIGIKILVERFRNLPSLPKLLRHELMHVSDMLDEQFGYKYRERLNVYSPMEENIIRSRYKLLWDIHIDSRLIRGGKETVSGKESRFREFESFYRNISGSYRITIFESLWQMETLTHNQILEMSRDINKLLYRFVTNVRREEIHDAEFLKTKILLPGLLCPLCRFPTYNWINNFDQHDENLIKLIKEDYPSWRAEEGACERCYDSYEVKAGKW